MGTGVAAPFIWGAGGRHSGWWLPAMDARLKDLWATGASAKVISELLTAEFPERPVTRNAVIGRAHRQELPPRENPAKQTPATQKRRAAIAAGRTCMWPKGDPKEKGFSFCGETTVEGKPYCQEHQSRAYVRGTALEK